MLYEISNESMKTVPEWPQGIGSIPIVLPDGSTAGVPVLKSTSILTLGATGYGKTVFTIKAVRVHLEAIPETKCVFFQIKPDDFTSEFLRDGDKIITFSPFADHPEKHFKWNMAKEIRLSADPEAEMKQLGNCLFDHLLNDSDHMIWAGAARDTFIAFLRTVIFCSADCPSNGAIIRSMRTSGLTELLEYLAHHPRNHALLKNTYGFDPDNNRAYRPPRKAEDTLFFLNDVLERFEGNFASFDGEDTIHDFLHNAESGRSLFIQHDNAQEEISQPFELYFLRKIVNDKCSPSAKVAKPLLMVLDEVDKVGGDFGATKASTLGRGFDLTLIVSTQSVENLYALAPGDNREHQTKAMMSGFPVFVAFHGGDPETIAELQTMFGSDYREITVQGISRYDPPVTKAELRPIVTDKDFATLDTGECYVKIRACPPQKVKIIQ